MLSIVEIVVLLLTLSAAFGWLNVYVFKLPHTIGLLIMALVGSVLLLAVEKLWPGLGIAATVGATIGQINFYTAMMEGMLSLLLFAGALHIDLSELRSQKWAIGIMASLGVIISTAIAGTGLWLAVNALGIELPLAWALVFGALISPTDPVAVMGLLKIVKVPDAIKAKIAGESLFNDGFAVVAFSVMLTLAMGPPEGAPPSAGMLALGEVLLYQVIGAMVFGLFTGWVAFHAMRSIDDHIVEILISIAACLATYATCHHLHLSAPIAVVVTGLFIGNQGAKHAMSPRVKEYLFTFWEVVDEILNSVLFMLIGLEVLLISLGPSLAPAGLVAIPIVLLARWVSVAVPIVALSTLQTFSRGVIPILTWGGLRGGVSVALALALPDNAFKPMLLAATYAVVVFSIVVQGLTVKHLIARTTAA